MEKANEIVGISPSESVTVALQDTVSVLVGALGSKLMLDTTGALFSMVAEVLSEAEPPKASTPVTEQTKLSPGCTKEGVRLRLAPVPMIVPSTDQA